MVAPVDDRHRGDRLTVALVEALAPVDARHHGDRRRSTPRAPRQRLTDTTDASPGRCSSPGDRLTRGLLRSMIDTTAAGCSPGRRQSTPRGPADARLAPVDHRHHGGRRRSTPRAPRGPADARLALVDAHQAGDDRHHGGRRRLARPRDACPGRGACPGESEVTCNHVKLGL